MADQPVIHLNRGPNRMKNGGTLWYQDEEPSGTDGDLWIRPSDGVPADAPSSA